MALSERGFIFFLLTLFLVTSQIHSETIYSTPNDAPGISTNHAKILNEYGCKIPVTISGWDVDFLVSGNFADSSQEDLAVLCKKNENNYIKIFWGGENQCNDEISSWGESLEAVDGEYIINHYEAYGGPEPSNITHQAINDIMLGKSSIVYYCSNGSWLEFTGAD